MGGRDPEFINSVPSECHAAYPKSISAPSGIPLLFFAIILNFQSPTIGSSRSEICKNAAGVNVPTPPNKSDWPQVVHVATCRTARPPAAPASVAQPQPKTPLPILAVSPSL